MLKEKPVNQGVRPKELKKMVLKLLQEERDWIYYKKVEAHRSYMLAMSYYKNLRYASMEDQKRGVTKQQSLISGMTWMDVD